MAKTKRGLRELDRQRRDVAARIRFEKSRPVLLDIFQNFRQHKPLQKFVTDNPLIMPDYKPPGRLEDRFIGKRFVSCATALEIIDHAVVEL